MLKFYLNLFCFCFCYFNSFSVHYICFQDNVCLRELEIRENINYYFFFINVDLMKPCGPHVLNFLEIFREYSEYSEYSDLWNDLFTIFTLFKRDGNSLKWMHELSTIWKNLILCIMHKYILYAILTHFTRPDDNKYSYNIKTRCKNGCKASHHVVYVRFIHTHTPSETGSS